MIKLTDIFVKNKETGKKYDVKKVNPEKHEFAWDYRGSKENPNPFKKEKPKKEGIEPNQKEMIDGIVEMLNQVEDIQNRKEMAMDRLRDFKKEGIEVNPKEFLERCGIDTVNEKWSAKYKRSIDCSHPKGFSQKAHCQGRKKHEIVEEAMELFLEKNCPTDPAKWSASKAAAKRKFDVYPSAYANGWAAKNYKSKGGGWKTCK
jgi:hypothetical protein